MSISLPLQKSPWPPGISDQGPCVRAYLGTEGCPLVGELGTAACSYNDGNKKVPEAFIQSGAVLYARALIN